MHIRKRIFLNEKKTQWCYVLLFGSKAEMQRHYKKISPSEDCNHYKVSGVHVCNGWFDVNTKKHFPMTGTVLLSMENCGAGIVSHELMHAVLYAWNNKKLSDNQFPIVIKSMKQEEEILYTHTSAVAQFYRWYWRTAEKYFANKKK